MKEYGKIHLKKNTHDGSYGLYCYRTYIRDDAMDAGFTLQ
ncbi:conserved hypothetical protein [Oenococcus oeni]|uniref:Uncharacterized protein n=2 Tax=Oenococcus oeni TaxID=1247 RepID=A0AAQ2US18_OENOE|nr:hypothetical protein AWRIB429_0811 [Oenococcus oeni AWRIB429]SYW00775.1 conserved hypothetical protein [Oenococcus oeni]SYW00969.1 conserved hypothetical protein [Oenococcus oeni]SYW03773.1 conserved hypothetical protein [Oenococcus oeni]SYW05285.1 conserved hypothetical protein [Oenococcus oeni]